jgi:hypothetical protein
MLKALEEFLPVIRLATTKKTSGGYAKPRHKFYFSDKAKIANDTSEALTKIIVGDIESEGRYTILSDLWKVGFKVPTHYHAKHFETFYLLTGEAK